jgi:hypothetical protein
MHYLREATAVDVLIGPFTDKTDGVTAEAGESPTVELSKNGQALAGKSDVTTPVYDSLGYYNCELDVTDTDTVGTLRLVVEASANAGPVFHDFTVLGGVVYDALYGTSPTMLTSKDIGQIYESTVQTVTSQTELDMDDTIVNDDDWIGLTVSITDIGTGDVSVRWIADVDQANDRIVLSSACAFTVSVADVVRVETREHPTYAIQKYDPPTRGEATSDRDILTAGMLTHAQIALRSDAAVATDRAAEIALINANEGSGAGNYLNTNDSQEAQSDRTPALSGGFVQADIQAVDGSAITNNIPADVQAVDGVAIVGEVPTNIVRVNGVLVTGDGGTGTEWGP